MPLKMVIEFQPESPINLPANNPNISAIIDIKQLHKAITINLDNTIVSLFIGITNKSIMVLSEYSLPKTQEVVNPKMSKPPIEITCDKDIR